MNKHQKKKDGNQQAIEQALTDARIPWRSVHMFPGLLDILAAPFGEFHFLEVKQKGQKLTVSEQKFFDLFPNAPRHMVTTPEEAFEKMAVGFCAICRTPQKVFPGVGVVIICDTCIPF